jgi:UDP-glucose 4-epimerase
LNHEAIVLDDLSGGFRDNVPEGAVFVEGSVTDEKLLTELFELYRFDYVYHLAAYAAEGLSHFIRRFNYSNNLLGSVNLINESVRHRVRCFVFTSSIAVYGAGQLPMREDQVPKPEDPYGVAKYSVELDLRAAHRMFGLNYVIFRPHNVYGEHQNIGDAYRNVIGIFMNQAMKGLPMTLFGDGSQTRAFTHVDDVASHIARSPETPSAMNEVFNIGADTPYSVLDLANRVATVFGVPSRIEFLPARTEVLHAYCSHEKVREIFGDQVNVDLDEGLSRMAAWARLHGPRATSPFAAIEISDKLPPSWAGLIKGAKNAAC